MLYILQAGICLFGIYILFAVLPAVVSFLSVFSAKRSAPYVALEPHPQLIARYGETVADACAFLRALDAKEVAITASDGARLCGVYYENNADKTVIFLHGFSANPVSHTALQARALYEKGYNLLLPYQRAHGKSGGRFSTLGLKEQTDLLDWIAWAKEKTDKILLYGMSMGASTVAYASDKLDPALVRGMILDCGFTSAYTQLSAECKRKRLPSALMMPVVRLLGRILFRVDLKRSTADSLRRAAVPALFLHGKCDLTVPVSATEENYAACAAQKEMILVEHAAHTEAFAAGGAPVQKRVSDFADRVMDR